MVAPALSIGGAGPGGTAPLPPLREDLELHPGPTGPGGSPTWTLYDPAAGRFLRLGWLEVEILARWGLGDAKAVAASIARDTTLAPGPAHVEAFARFATEAGLVRAADAAGLDRLKRQAARKRLHPAMWLLKNYLFVRIPLVRPDKWLERNLPLAAAFFSSLFLWLTVAAGSAGLFMVLRQWDTFLATVPEVFTVEGALYGAAALGLAKAVHELGHAFTAKRHGCRVPGMGVALMVMWPTLYTDTTEAWRLVSRRARLQIAGAGMAVELALGCWALLAWSLLPDGPLRFACFLLATVTWVLTLAVNLNPFMRFDGYYLLADGLGMDNLQPRSFALARWRLRETLFGFGEPPPEVFPERLRRFLVVYAIATWIYRLVLYLGIALLVYHLAFKLLGLFLMVVELGWFLAFPMANEMREWWKRREKIRPNLNLARTVVLAGVALALVLVPWPARVGAPAVLRAEVQRIVYTPRAGEVVQLPVRTGDGLAAGDVIAVLHDPDLAHRLAQAERKVATLEAARDGQQMTATLARQNPVTISTLEAAIADAAGLRLEADLLTVRADAAGRLVELPDHVRPGARLAANEPIAVLAGGDRPLVEAFVPETALRRLSTGATARFVPDHGMGAALALTVMDIETTAVSDLSEPMLASPAGGRIPVAPDAEGRLVPARAVYRVLLAPQPGTALPERTVRGFVRIAAEPESLAQSAWRTVVAVLVRESGF